MYQNTGSTRIINHSELKANSSQEKIDFMVQAKLYVNHAYLWFQKIFKKVSFYAVRFFNLLVTTIKTHNYKQSISSFKSFIARANSNIKLSTGNAIKKTGLSEKSRSLGQVISYKTSGARYSFCLHLLDVSKKHYTNQTSSVLSKIFLKMHNVFLENDDADSAKKCLENAENAMIDKHLPEVLMACGYFYMRNKSSVNRAITYFKRAVIVSRGQCLKSEQDPAFIWMLIGKSPEFFESDERIDIELESYNKAKQLLEEAVDLYRSYRVQLAQKVDSISKINRAPATVGDVDMASFDRSFLNNAIQKVYTAWQTLPEPKHSWECSRLITQLMFFMCDEWGDRDTAIFFAKENIKCVGGGRNPNLRYQLGVHSYEIEEKHNLARAHFRFAKEYSKGKVFRTYTEESAKYSALL